MRYLSRNTLALFLLAGFGATLFMGCDDPADDYYPPEELEFTTKPRMPSAPKSQSDEDVQKKTNGCIVCHKGIENPSMHVSEAVKLGCVDCHGGDGLAKTKEEAHVQPRGPWYSLSHGEHLNSGTPKRAHHVWQKESPEFIRFINPGDLRVAKYSCGECHPGYSDRVSHSMMAHAGMIFGAALYNNGVSNVKTGRFGEAYTYDGRPARLQSIDVADDGKVTIYKPTDKDIREKGIVAFLDPLPRYNITQPGNILRAFERGGRIRPQPALPDGRNVIQPFLNEPGKPEFKLSIRGFGTQLSTDPVYLGLQKLRLWDPILWHPGTNDQAGDYRASGCSSCHVVYANDRDPVHSAHYAKFGKDGFTFTKDEALKHAVGKEHGHPISHTLTKAVPSSQCIVCHVHPGTTVTLTYYGNLWYDNESEGDKVYPKSHPKKMGEGKAYKIKVRNPEGSALRGKWKDVAWTEKLWERNKEFKKVQFADYHGHGWLYRNVYKRDRKGNMLDKDDNVVPDDSPHKFKKGESGEPVPGAGVHLQDIHLEKGMHCVDCHFDVDNHGNGKLYSQVRDATEINCIDCHGTIYKTATLVTSGLAAPEGGTKLSRTNTPFGKRFRKVGDKIFQYSSVTEGLKWELTQVKDVVTPGHPKYNEDARRAKTMRKDNKTWGDVPADPKQLAHSDSNMDCYVCHTSWMASCFGCHLPMTANQKRKNNHYEGGKSRNWTQYNWQTLRSDLFMLGLDSTTKKNKVAPVRSACAVIVGSQNANREWIYSQQQTVSAEGFSGHSFSPHYPHAVRGGKETKRCSDCHLSEEKNSNAWMAQILMQGTNQTNFMYRLLYVACEDGGLASVVVTEREEPQAVIGSTLHRDSFPEEYAKHVAKGKELKTVHHHSGNVLTAQLRGEYVYSARGSGGLTIFDVSNVDNKGFSERIVTAPVSPLGQRLYVKSKDCTSVISPTVLGVDPTRQPPLRPRKGANQEQGISLTYAFLYATDREEGVFTTLAGTLLDGDPTNNFMTRHITFNPGGLLNGAVGGVVAGNYFYVCCDRGLVVIDISKIGSELVEAAVKLNPDGKKVLSLKEIGRAARKADPNDFKVVSVIELNQAKAVRIQFRYAFVVDGDGMKVIDITDPTKAKLVEGSTVPFKDARNIYLSRTYAYVAAGSEGVGIVDIEKAESPKLNQTFNAGGKLDDVYDVKIGMTNTSPFAYVANGKHGLAILQLVDTEHPGYLGWSPEPKPVLIATKHLHGKAVNISEGLKRDRAVDESGNQLGVFGRVGSRPFNKQEMERMYMLDGKLFRVSDKANTKPNEMKAAGGGGGADPVLKAKVEALEKKIKRERNPSKKRKLKKELETLKKQLEASASSGGDKQKEIAALEKKIKRERNPSKRRKLKKALEALKK